MCSDTGRKQRSLDSMKLRGAAKRWGSKLKVTVASTTKKTAKAYIYKVLPALIYREKKAVACNLALQVRKSEFPRMLL